MAKKYIQDCILKTKKIDATDALFPDYNGSPDNLSKTNSCLKIIESFEKDGLVPQKAEQAFARTKDRLDLQVKMFSPNVSNRDEIVSKYIDMAFMESVAWRRYESSVSKKEQDFNIVNYSEKDTSYLPIIIAVAALIFFVVLNKRKEKRLEEKKG